MITISTTYFHYFVAYTGQYHLTNSILPMKDQGGLKRGVGFFIPDGLAGRLKGLEYSIAAFQAFVKRVIKFGEKSLTSPTP
jgi:hypothetical protein